MIIGIILGSIVSIGLSIGIEIKNLCGVFKKIADNGYVLDLDKFEEFKSINNPNLMDKFFWNYVPVINLLNALRKTNKFSNITDENVVELCNHVCFRKMNDEERSMYFENPYGIIALCLPIITDRNNSIHNGIYIEQNDSNDYSVEFDLNSKTGEVTLKSLNIKKCILSLNDVEQNIRDTYLAQSESQSDKHNLELRNVTVDSSKANEVKKESTSPYYVANYEIRKGNATISRKLTQQGFDNVSRLMREDLELLEENDGPKLRLR